MFRITFSQRCTTTVQFVFLRHPRNRWYFVSFINWNEIGHSESSAFQDATGRCRRQDAGSVIMRRKSDKKAKCNYPASQSECQMRASVFLPLLLCCSCFASPERSSVISHLASAQQYLGLNKFTVLEHCGPKCSVNLHVRQLHPPRCDLGGCRLWRTRSSYSIKTATTRGGVGEGEWESVIAPLALK